MFAPSHRPDDNPSYAKLKRDLGDDAPLLNFLPYKRATFEPQNEIAEAAPERLLYGDMLESKGQLWVYWTLNYHKKQKSNRDYRMVTFQTIEGAKNHKAGVRPGLVREVALASWPFKYAEDQYALAAIAKYFFVRRGIDMQLQYPMSSEPFREALMRACQQYKAVYDEKQANKPAGRRLSIMPTGGNHGIAHAQSQSLREPSYTHSTALSLAHSPTPSSAPSQTSLRAPSRVTSRGPSRPMSMASVHTRKRQRSSSADHYSEPRQPPGLPAQLSGRSVTHQEPGSLSSNSRLPSPFLAAVQSGLDEHPEDGDLEEPQVGNNNDAELEQSADGERLTSIDREAMMDDYIALKAQEEELDSKISDVEREGNHIAGQVADLQADIDAIRERQLDLEEEKGRVQTEKKKLQIQLDKNEHLDFGFEAGRKMENKRQRKE
jgi:hypothetical protein